MEKMLIGLVLIGLFSMLLVTVVSAVKNSARNMMHDDGLTDEYEQYIESLKKHENVLTENIVKLEEKLKKLETIEYNAIRDFSPEQEKAFDLYHNNGIHLPVDIIDDVLYLSPVTFEETVKLIESKRQNWKNELSKKVFLGGSI